MNILPYAGMQLTRNPTPFLFRSKTMCIPKPALIAYRCFSQKYDALSGPVFLLHNAVKRGDLIRVRQILKTDILEVNGLNSEGESPLGIAVRQYFSKENYSPKILSELHSYGACYLYEDGSGKAPLEHIITKKKDEEKLFSMEERGIRIDALYHCIDGCGMSINGCTNTCKKESQDYSAEFKAKVALESLTTSLSVNKLAQKHSVKSWEVIKWRRQARENLAHLFK